VTQTGAYSLGNMPQTGSNLFVDSASIWGTVTRIQCPKMGHIHLETMPQTGAQSLGNLSQIGIIYVLSELIILSKLL